MGQADPEQACPRIEAWLEPFWRCVIWAGLFYLLLLTFRPAMDSPFVYDDVANIVENPDFRRDGALSHLFRNHATSMQFDHRPVVGAVSLLNFKVCGLNPSGYHAFNLFVHWLVAVAIGEALIVLGARLALPFPRLSALSITWLWAVHPLNSVTVIYISQRAESMMTLFYVLAILCLLRADGSAHRKSLLGLSGLAVALAMGSKEVAITLPVALLLFDRACVASSFREIWSTRRWYYISIAAVTIGFVAWWFSGIRIRELGGNVLANPWEYLKIQARVVVDYIRLVFWPSPLVFVHSSRFVTSWQQWIPHASLLLALIWVAVVAFRRKLWLALAIGMFFIVLAPTSSVMPIPQEIAAEWRMYLPSATVVAVVVGVSWALLARVRLENYGIGLAAVLVAAFAFVSNERSKVFATKESIWSDVVSKDPFSHRAWANLAVARLEKGDLAGARECANQLLGLGQATGDRYSTAASHQIYGWIALGDSDFETAEEHFVSALDADPACKMAGANLAQALAAQGKFARALDALSDELARYPDSLRARLIRAQIVRDQAAPKKKMLEPKTGSANVPGSQ